MERKKVLIVAGLILLLIILSRPEVEGELLALLFLGVIPGTSIALPSWMIFIGSIFAASALLRWLRDQPLFIGSHVEQEKLARQLARKKVLAMTAIPAPAAASPIRPKHINAVNRRRAAKA